MDTIHAIKQFEIKDKLVFTTTHGVLPIAHITTEHAEATISLYGAQLLSYIPCHQQDVLWMSKQSFFETGKAIRGGIPVCFPWFGPHLTDKTKPQHGFARLLQWQVQGAAALTTGAVKLTLLLEPSDYTKALWPYEFKAQVDFTIGDTADIALTVTNTGQQDFEYSNALHTYFNIGHINNIAVTGLEKTIYYNAFETTEQEQPAQPLRFLTETNRRYIQHTQNCVIQDELLQRNICVSKTGSLVTIVWNPCEATAATMLDIHPGGYKHFVCIEPANAYPGIDMVQLQPGQSHTLSTGIALC
ncbi:MAG: hypothetical protein RL172_1195 [Bacteroidota bacterium]|jgi:glucose-6-phosphate 1-epimerase